MSRARSKGLGDINPQYLSAFTTSAAVNDYSIKQINLPVTRLGGSKNKAVVFEILSIDWYLAVGNIDSSITQTVFSFLSTGTWALRISLISPVLKLAFCPQSSTAWKERPQQLDRWLSTPSAL